MSAVPTVLGPVDTAELGTTYMHEHIFVLTPDAQQNYPEEWGSKEAWWPTPWPGWVSWPPPGSGPSSIPPWWA